MKNLEVRLSELGTNYNLVIRIDQNLRVSTLKDMKAVVSQLDLLNYGTKENIKKILTTQLNGFEPGKNWEVTYTFAQSCIELTNKMYKSSKVKYNEHEKFIVNTIAEM